MIPDGYPDHVRALQLGTEAALAAHGYDAVVVCSGRAASRSMFDDQAWPLLPTPAFAHWCPLVEPDAYLVVRAGEPPTLVRTRIDDFWESQPELEDPAILDAFRVVEVDPRRAADALPRGRVAVISRDPDAAPDLDGALNPPALIAALDALRTRKTAYEIECLAEASRRAALGHGRVAAIFASGAASELELHLAYLAASEQDDAAAAYKHIIALGPHAAVLHHVNYGKQRVSGDTSFLVDAGAKYLGYGSDITRTYVRGASPGAILFRALIAHVEAVQQEVIRRIRVGLAYEALHDETHQLLAPALRELGIARGSDDELIDRGITRALFPHGLGHSLGITVHDVGMRLTPPTVRNPFLRNTSTIEAGQVFTIEPGVYVIDGLLGPVEADPARRPLLDWDAIAALRPFGGVRIEDNIAVEAAGTRNLTREAFVDAQT